MYIVVWIDIAQELRLLKNFSSLKAIITGLNSSAIYRLRKIWSFLSKDKVTVGQKVRNKLKAYKGNM